MLGGLFSGIGSFLGQRAQADAMKYQARIQKEMYDQTRQDLIPYMQGGGLGLSAYMNEVGRGPYWGYTPPTIPGSVRRPDAPDFSLGTIGASYRQSPGYQYMLDQGQRALQRSQAARGMLQSGGALAELQRHAMGAANQDYYNYVDQTRRGLQDNYQAALTNYGLQTTERDQQYNWLLNQQMLGHQMRRDYMGDLQWLTGMGHRAAAKTA